MFCGNCGAENLESQNFCSRCGKPLAKAATSAANPAPAVAPAKTTPPVDASESFSLNTLIAPRITTPKEAAGAARRGAIAAGIVAIFQFFAYIQGVGLIALLSGAIFLPVAVALWRKQVLGGILGLLVSLLNLVGGFFVADEAGLTGRGLDTFLKIVLVVNAGLAVLFINAIRGCVKYQKLGGAS